MKLTNRFLKLSENYLIPIVLSEDDEFTTKEDSGMNVIKTRVGSSGRFFIVDEDGSIQKLSRM